MNGVITLEALKNQMSSLDAQAAEARKAHQQAAERLLQIEGARQLCQGMIDKVIEALAKMPVAGEEATEEAK